MVIENGPLSKTSEFLQAMVSSRIGCSAASWVLRTLLAWRLGSTRVVRDYLGENQ